MKTSLKLACLRHLHDTFGVEDYRPGQKAAVQALFSGRDVMCILPTGAGKSLCWQLPAVVHAGLTVVVSPLIALMRDQVQHLAELGVPAVSLDSLMTPDERRAAMERIRAGAVRIVFVSPERLEHASFRRLCRELSPWLVVVDEAHCVVQWGEGFRPAYAAIAGFLRTLAKRPVLCALTATADTAMQHAIRDSLGMRRPRSVLLPIVRENLRYKVHTTLDRTADILRMVHQKPCRTVVFCRTRARTERLAALLTESGATAAFYHAGLDREKRMQTQQSFIDGAVSVLCATTAFGMGIDIPDIRRVIHDELPDSLIDYVQQSGRAGRDGKEAECILLLEPNHLVHRADLRRRQPVALRLHPLRRWRRVREGRRKLRQLLTALLASDCIPAAIASAFGGRTRPCGRCSACERGALLPRVPDIGAMREWQVRAFLLKWQRDALAGRQACRPDQIMADSAIYTAAKKFAFPPQAPAPPQLQRLLTHFCGGRMHDSGGSGV